MINFDDTLNDELGEDFGFINTPSFIRSKWRELRLQWEALVSPYSSISNGNITPPNFVKTQYKLWLEAHRSFVENDGGGWWGSSISAWNNEAKRYANTYNYIQQLRDTHARTPNANLDLTPSPLASGASPPIDLLPATDPTNPTESNESKWFDPATWKLNFGQVALLGLGTFVAYNVFFRLREGRRRNV